MRCLGSLEEERVVLRSTEICGLHSTTLRTLHSPRSAKLHTLCTGAQLLSMCFVSCLKFLLASAPSNSLPGCARAAGWSAPRFSEHACFSPCFKLPHATYLTTHDVAYGNFLLGGLLSVGKNIVPLPSILDMEPCFFEYRAVAREPNENNPVISGPTPSPCGSACACNERRSALSWVLR